MSAQDDKQAKEERRGAGQGVEGGQGVEKRGRGGEISRRTKSR